MSLNSEMHMSIRSPMHVDCMTCFEPPSADLCSDLVPKITCQVRSTGLSLAYGFEHLLVPSRLAFLQRSASGTVMPAA